MTKKKSNIIIAFCLLLILIDTRISFAQENSLYDPLNLNQKDHNFIKRVPVTIKKSFITAITAEEANHSIVITGIPEINAITETKGREVTVKFPYGTLHKSISSSTYNWNYKLTNQYKNIVRASVTQNSPSEGVIIKLLFTSPVYVETIQPAPSKILLKLSEISRKDSRTTTIIADNNIDNELINRYSINRDYSTSKNTFNIRPSGKYTTISPEAKRIHDTDNTITSLNSTANRTHSHTAPPDRYISQPDKQTKTEIEKKPDQISFTPDIEEQIKTIPSDLPLKQGSEEVNELKPGTPKQYERSDNVFSDTPEKLPPLQRPERTRNEMLDKADYSDIIRIGLSLESELKHKDAIQKFSQAIILDPSRYEAYSALGDIYLKQKKYDLAIENYEKALTINPDLIKVLFNLAVSYNNLQKYDKALQYFDKMLAIRPESYEANYHVANIYFIKGEYENSLQYYGTCLELVKRSKNKMETARIHYNIANTYKAQESYDKAIREYRKAIKYHKEFSDAYYNLAATYVDSNRYDKAIEAFKDYQNYVSSQAEIERVQKIIQQLEEDN
jgi:tetratricopeptide (TPR) repeat protein